MPTGKGRLCFLGDLLSNVVAARVKAPKTEQAASAAVATRGEAWQ